jgi:hypothetical protein
VIADPNNEILISPASYWETAIKVSIGKYLLSVPYETFITQGVDGNATAVSTASTAYRNQAAARSALVAIWRRSVRSGAFPTDVRPAVTRNIGKVSANATR